MGERELERERERHNAYGCYDNTVSVYGTVQFSMVWYGTGGLVEGEGVFILLYKSVFTKSPLFLALSPFLCRSLFSVHVRNTYFVT